MTFAAKHPLPDETSYSHTDPMKVLHEAFRVQQWDEVRLARRAQIELSVLREIMSGESIADARELRDLFKAMNIRCFFRGWGVRLGGSAAGESGSGSAPAADGGGGDGGSSGAGGALAGQGLVDGGGFGVDQGNAQAEGGAQTLHLVNGQDAVSAEEL